MDPIASTLLQSGIPGLIALIAGVVIRALFQRMEEDHDQEVARLLAQIESDRAQGAAVVAAERGRADRLEAELNRMNGAIQSGYVDTLVKASAAIIESTRAVADATAAVRRS